MHALSPFSHSVESLQLINSYSMPQKKKKKHLELSKRYKKVDRELSLLKS